MKKKQVRQQKTKPYSLLILIAFSFSLFSCTQGRKEYSRVDFVLGTVCQIRILSDKPKSEVNKIFDETFDELKKLDAIFNANTKASNLDSENICEGLSTDSSELEELNQNAGIKAISVSKELFELLKTSITIAELSEGTFNPAIGNLVKLWDIGFSGKTVPSKEKILTSLSLIDYKDIVLQEKISANGNTEYSVFLKKQGMRLDLGGIAKGYATDKVVEIIKKHKIKDALIDIGGNVFAMGKNKKQQNWAVGLRNPKIGESGISAYIKISDKSLVTSGNYERYFKEDGKVYHHILDSKTGYPSQSKINAVSVISNSSIYADALSTTCFILGEEKSQSLLANLENVRENEITVIFFYDDNSIKIIGNTDCALTAHKPYFLK